MGYTNVASVNTELWRTGAGAVGSISIGTAATIGTTDFNNVVVPHVDAIINGIVGCRYKVPFSTPYPPLIKTIATQLAAGEVLKIVTQYRQDDASDFLFDKSRLAFYEANAWLDKIAKGQMHVVGAIVESVPQHADSESMGDADEPIFEVESEKTHISPIF